MLKKLFNIFAVIVFFVCRPDTLLAGYSGIMLDWQPFIISDYLKLNHPAQNILPENSISAEKIRQGLENIDTLLPEDLLIIEDQPEAETKKSLLSKIKISISPNSSFMLPGNGNYSPATEGKISRAAVILPSLIKNPSQETVLETLKLIEPQVNIGIEF